MKKFIFVLFAIVGIAFSSVSTSAAEKIQQQPALQKANDALAYRHRYKRCYNLPRHYLTTCYRKAKRYCYRNRYRLSANVSVKHCRYKLRRACRYQYYKYRRCTYYY